MKTHSTRRRVAAGAALATLAAVSFLISGHVPSAEGQGRRRNANNNTQQAVPEAQRTGDLRTIDVKADKVQDEFIREAANLALEYEKAGDLERAIQLLEAVLKIKPDLTQAEQKIDDLKDEILAANDYRIEIPADGSWGKAVAFVRKDKPFRIEAKGNYKFSASLTVGPEGFPTKDLQRDMLPGIPCGTLAGMILTRDKPGEPFTVGSEREFTPPENGLLFLKVNVPPGSKCSGEIDVTISGYVLSPDRNNIGK